jgi:hypothetical protein
VVAKADGASGASWIVTDYSCYNLDDIWASVNQRDTQTWPQIDAWNTMASICAEQAGQLKLALAQLMQRWVPTPGSAAEAFAATVNTLIAAMQRDATAAKGMQPVLEQITTGLADTKDKVQALIDQRDRYEAVEQAHLANPMAIRFAPASSSLPELMKESVPGNWRQDLRTQAVTVMHAGDAAIGTATAHMPTLVEMMNPVDSLITTIEPPPPGGNNGGVTRPPLAADRRLPLLADADRPGSTAVALAQPAANSQPMLAGQTTVVDPSSDHLPDVLRTAPPSTWERLPQVAFSPVAQSLGPPGRVIDGSTPGRAVQPTSTDGIENSQSMTAGGQTMLPPGGQLRPAVSRSTMRPAGRAALWASQRERKRRGDDPWSVRIGVPPVIEPGDPPEHDPGPGVIGLDR